MGAVRKHFTEIRSSYSQAMSRWTTSGNGNGIVTRAQIVANPDTVFSADFKSYTAGDIVIYYYFCVLRHFNIGKQLSTDLLDGCGSSSTGVNNYNTNQPRPVSMIGNHPAHRSSPPSTSDDILSLLNQPLNINLSRSDTPSQQPAQETDLKRKLDLVDLRTKQRDLCVGLENDLKVKKARLQEARALLRTDPFPAEQDISDIQA